MSGTLWTAERCRRTQCQQEGAVRMTHSRIWQQKKEKPPCVEANFNSRDAKSPLFLRYLWHHHNGTQKSARWGGRISDKKERKKCKGKDAKGEERLTKGPGSKITWVINCTGNYKPELNGVTWLVHTTFVNPALIIPVTPHKLIAPI